MTPRNRANRTLEARMQEWIGKMDESSIFMAAKELIHFDEWSKDVYERVKDLNIQKYPYRDFLYQIYDEETEE